METTFGAIMGATLAFGAWRNRALVASGVDAPPGEPIGAVDRRPWSVGLECVGLATHVVLLTLAEFTDVPVLSRYADVPVLMGVLPVALAVRGRWAPAVIALPVTALPIAGKTVRRLVFEQHAIAPLLGWLAYAVVPLTLMGVAAGVWRTRHVEDARKVWRCAGPCCWRRGCTSA